MQVWQGPSVIDGSPIVVLATFGSSNVKTGPMVQLWIVRSDMHPTEARSIGADTAICGDCPFRSVAAGGNAGCYAGRGMSAMGTGSAWKSWNRGNAAEFDLSKFVGQPVRFGAYGDPAAVPFEVWEPILAVASGVTGYTHQWRTADPRFAEFCMASTESVEGRRDARQRGYRSFDVLALGESPARGQIVCPATRIDTVTCASCMQCGGTGSGRTADIVVTAHGGGASAITR